MSEYRNDFRRGFTGFRKPETITNEALEAAISRIDTRNRFIFYTGNGYNARRLSLRSNSLAAIKTVGVPVPLAEFIRLAARAVGDEEGYDPKAAVSGLYLHRNSKPAVYFELRKNVAGDYVSANNVPYADPTLFPKGLKVGDVVVSAERAEAPPTAPEGSLELPETKAGPRKGKGRR
jgi:hypothetical protein